MFRFRPIVALLPLAVIACAAAPVRTTGTGAESADPARAIVSGPVRGENLCCGIVPDGGTEWLCVR